MASVNILNRAFEEILSLLSLRQIILAAHNFRSCPLSFLLSHRVMGEIRRFV